MQCVSDILIKHEYCRRICFWKLLCWNIEKWTQKNSKQLNKTKTYPRKEHFWELSKTSSHYTLFSIFVLVFSKRWQKAMLKEMMRYIEGPPTRDRSCLSWSPLFVRQLMLIWSAEVDGGLCCARLTVRSSPCLELNLNINNKAEIGPFTFSCNLWILIIAY